jgi:hypothetical protein
LHQRVLQASTPTRQTSAQIFWRLSCLRVQRSVTTPTASLPSDVLREGVVGTITTLDPLYATALVLEKDGTRAALVSLDLIGTTFGMVAEARKLIEAGTGIPAGHVMISATHSHTGPVLSDDKPRDEAFGGGSDLAKSFIKALPAKIAEAVRNADAARVPAKMFRGIGREDGLAFNRRFHMTDGTVGWNPGKLNPKILKPAGTIDPEVPFVFFDYACAKALLIYPCIHRE